jgi:SRSO17 transposase
MKTYTPELDPAILQRLAAYAALFAEDFPQAKPARWSGVYLQGLLLDGERKSIEPLAGRVTLPADLHANDVEQALQQFVNQSPWNDQKVLRRYRGHLAATFASPQGCFIIDDTSFPKQGKHSVGVQRQYCGALGKKANCQAAVSVHYVSPKGHYPLALRLYLPHSWTSDHDRLRAAQVPLRYWRFRTKGQIALELLDQVRGEGLPGQVVITDAGYGVSGPFRDALAARGLFYLAGVTEDTIVFAEPPVWQPPAPTANGRPQTLPHLDPQGPQPLAVRELARRTLLRRRTWREGTKGKLSGRFAWLRVWLAGGWERGACAGAEPLWLLIEEQADGTLAGGAGLPADEGGIGLGPLRGPLLAGLPSSRLPGHVGLRLLGLGETASGGGRGHPDQGRKKKRYRPDVACGAARLATPVGAPGPTRLSVLPTTTINPTAGLTE